MKLTETPTALLTAILLTLALAGCSKSMGAAPGQADAVATNAAGGDVAITGSTGSGEPGYLDGRKLERNAWMTVEVDDEDDIRPALEHAKKLARAADGYIQNESSESLTMMVPTNRADGFLDQLSKLGEVTNRQVSVVDVTSNYVDLQIRIDNLDKTRHRLQQLLTQSTKVEDVLAVEKELARVTTELERLKGKMRTMNRDTTYATISLSVEEEVTPGPVGWVFYGGYKAVKWLFVWD